MATKTKKASVKTNSESTTKRWIRIEASGYKTLVYGENQKGQFSLLKLGKEGRVQPVPRQAADAILRQLLSEYEIL